MVYTIGNSILAYNVPLGTLQVISETPRPEWQKCFGPHAWQQGFGTGSTVSGLMCYHCNNEEKGCSHILAFFMPTRQFRLSGDIMFLTGPFVRLFVRPSACLSVRLFVCYKFSEHGISKTAEPILLQISTDNPRGTEMKRSTFWVRRSKFKVTQRRGLAEAPLSTPSVEYIF